MSVVRRSCVVDPVAGRHRLVVAVAVVLPAGGRPAVVERRLAVEVDLDLAVHAAHDAQQHVVGVVVRGRPAVGVRPLLLVMPRADQQHVADDDPAAGRVPARLQDHRARQVAPRGRHLDAVGADPEHAGIAVQDRPEHARRVEPRQAHPLDVAARRHQRARLAIREEGVVRDRRKRARANPAAGVEGRQVATFLTGPPVAVKRVDAAARHHSVLAPPSSDARYWISRQSPRVAGSARYVDASRARKRCCLADIGFARTSRFALRAGARRTSAAARRCRARDRRCRCSGRGSTTPTRACRQAASTRSASASSDSRCRGTACPRRTTRRRPSSRSRRSSAPSRSRRPAGTARRSDVSPPAGTAPRSRRSSAGTCAWASTATPRRCSCP